VADEMLHHPFAPKRARVLSVSNPVADGEITDQSQGKDAYHKTHDSRGRSAVVRVKTVNFYGGKNGLAGCVMTE
jgi:hypothetical protein